MALGRKIEALLTLRPDVAIVCECASPDELELERDDHRSVWIGENPRKGLAVLAFNGYQVSLAAPYYPTLRYIAPVRIRGPVECNLLAVWAQNWSAGLTRKRQSGPLRRALGKYRDFLAERPAVIAGDLNSNAIWDKPGWRMNHMTKVEILKAWNMVSAYHEIRGEAHGRETEPTLYWRDRKKDGPTYHIDYVFMPEAWIARVTHLSVGSFEEWCGSGLSDHVPIVVEVEL
jgi:exodeoxyribonuclease-3